MMPPEGTETETADYHVYGMRLRGFAPGCQPMDGLVEGKDDPSGKYHSILVYNRELSADEVEEYELDVI